MLERERKERKRGPWKRNWSKRRKCGRGIHIEKKCINYRQKRAAKSNMMDKDNIGRKREVHGGGTGVR